jgi:hypothetical protein
MYSDDEQDGDDAAAILRAISPPYLLLYEKQEGEVRRWASIEVESGEEDEHPRTGCYPALRFFDSVEGFYTVRSSLSP